MSVQGAHYKKKKKKAPVVIPRCQEFFAMCSNSLVAIILEHNGLTNFLPDSSLLSS
jgi:hypothetical protein